MTRSVVILATCVLVFLPLAAPAVPEGVKLTWEGGGAGPVIFDGTVHAKQGLACDVCHVAGQFHTQKGADPITMDALKKDQYCGYCHNGTRAFSTKKTSDCGRCHKKKK